MKIIKRNGTKVPFNKEKIENAIIKAMRFGSGIYEPEIAKSISKDIEKTFMYLGQEEIDISQIENVVYKLLIDNKQELTAKAYEGYRAVQAFKRKSNTTDDHILGVIDKSNKDIMRENSNKNAVLASTQRDLFAGIMSKDLARRRLLPNHIVQAHDEGILHYHDMDYAVQQIHNCMLINIKDMLANGTAINGKAIESPTNFITACHVYTQIIAQIASSQYGGNSTTLAHLAPYLKKSHDKYITFYKDNGLDDDLANKLALKQTKQDLKAGIQSIRYQISTMHTSNGQAPFCTIYLEVNENSEFAEYEAMLVEEMITQRLKGMKNYKGQVIGEEFPKLVYLLDEHNCLEGGKYDYLTKLSAKCSAKRLVPDYQSAKLMRENYEGNTFPPMG